MTKGPNFSFVEFIEEGRTTKEMRQFQKWFFFSNSFSRNSKKILKKIFYGYVRSTVIMVIVRDSSNFPIIIFPLLSSYFPTAARTYAWINCTIKDWLHGWLVGTSAHTKCICGYHKNPYASERSELHFVASFARLRNLWFLNRANNYVYFKDPKYSIFYWLPKKSKIAQNGKKKHFQCFNIFVGSKNHYGFEM